MPNMKMIINGTIWSAIGIWGRKLIGFVVFAILARHVSPESLGLASLAMVCISFFELLSKQGISMALIQRKEVNSAILNTAFIINITTALIIVAISVVFAKEIAIGMGDEKLENIIRALTVIIIFSASNVVPIALQSRDFDFKSMTFQTFSGTVASALVSISLAIAGFEVWALVAQSITFAIVSSATIWIRTKWRPRLNFDKREFKGLTSFSLKILLSNLIGFIRTRFDQVLLGITLGPIGLGLYMVGLKIGDTIGAFIKEPIGQVALPAFSKINNDRQKLIDVIDRGMRLNALISLPIYTGLALLSNEAISIAFGEKWLEAAMICSIFSIRLLTTNLFFLNYHLFVSQGFPGTHTVIQVIQSIGIIVSAFIGKKWGPEGVAIGGLISDVIIFNVIGTITLCKKLKIPHYKMYTSMVNPAICTVVMCTSIILFKKILVQYSNSPFFLAATLIPIGMVAYIGTLRFVFPKTFNEIMQLTTFLKKEKVASV